MSDFYKEIIRNYWMPFIAISLITFAYLYSSTPYYVNAVIPVSQESADGHLYFDIGYSYKNQFKVPIVNKTAVIANTFANISLIKTIAIKNKAGDFIELPFNSDQFKTFDKNYIYHEILLSLVISYFLILIVAQRNKICEYLVQNKQSVFIFLLIFAYYFALVMIMSPALSDDSQTQYQVVGDVRNNHFTITYAFLAVCGYILFGSPPWIFNIISLFAVTFTVFYCHLIAKKVNNFFGIAFLILTPFFPVLISEMVISERPGVALWSLAGLVIAIYDYLNNTSGRKQFYLAFFFLSLATMARPQEFFFFVGALLLYFMRKQNLRTAVIWAALLPSLILTLALVSEKQISGSIGQAVAWRTALTQMSQVGYLVRDDLLSEEHTRLLGKYIDLKLVKEKWAEGDYMTNTYPLHTVFYDDQYPELAGTIYSTYIKKYPLKFLQSRLRFTYKAFMVSLFTWSRFQHFADNVAYNQVISANQMLWDNTRAAVRFDNYYPSYLKTKLYTLFRTLQNTYHISFVLSVILYLLSFYFCTKSYQGKLNLIALIAIAIGPCASFSGIVVLGSAANYAYFMNISPMLLVVSPLCIPFFVNYLKNRHTLKE